MIGQNSDLRNTKLRESVFLQEETDSEERVSRAMIDTKQFTKLVREHLSPFMRDHGFKGSSFRYTKLTEEHYVYALKIMANKYGGSCCIDLAVHFDFLPYNADEEIVPPNKVDPWACDFRKRLAPRGLDTDSWWEYGNNEAESLESISDMKNKFIQLGLPYLGQFRDFPEPFYSIKVAELEEYKRDMSRGGISHDSRLYKLGSPPEIRLAMRIAQVNLFIGDYDKAKMFAEWALKQIVDFRGSGMIAVLKDIIVKSSLENRV